MILPILGLSGGCRAPFQGEGASGGGGDGAGGSATEGARSGNGAGADCSGSNGTLSEEIFRIRREKMVRTQIEARGIHDARILAAFRKVPRHLFIPVPQRESAYEDSPVPIGEGQTISQPYIVALMTELAGPGPRARVLEVGTGSGYQAAVLAELVADVYTIEILEPLARRSASLLRDLGYRNVHARIGDGYRGWAEAGPFDAILVTAAPGRIPAPLEEQLALGGRMVIPVGFDSQDLVLVRRTASGFLEERIAAVRFVPMTGEAEQKP